MSDFYIDFANNQHYTYDDLIKDILCTTHYQKYCYTNDFYSIFKNIILSLLLNKDIVVLDYDFTIDEIKKLLGFDNIDESEPITLDHLKHLSTRDELIRELSNVSKSWSLTLFTSGTTGLPKRVKHSFQSLTRFVKISQSKSKDVWGFAYNPTHIAGIQVFFQALFNGNLIIRLFGLSKNVIFHSISNWHITNISATPTFFRLLLPHQGQYPSVQRITTGGEKLDEKLLVKLKMLFPNAKYTNVYASTEAGTLFAAHNNIFTVKAEQRHLVEIRDGELFIHQSLLGATDFVKDEWYPTGDLVEVISQEPLSFIFLARRNEMINVGGYKVNPNEVEEVIRSIESVIDVRVFSKPNSVLGNIVCCEIVSDSEDLEESTIRKYLQSKLQEYKIPRVISFVKEISKTRTGKTKR